MKKFLSHYAENSVDFKLETRERKYLIFGQEEEALLQEDMWCSKTRKSEQKNGMMQKIMKKIDCILKQTVSLSSPLSSSKTSKPQLTTEGVDEELFF